MQSIELLDIQQFSQKNLIPIRKFQKFLFPISPIRKFRKFLFPFFSDPEIPKNISSDPIRKILQRFFPIRMFRTFFFPVFSDPEIPVFFCFRFFSDPKIPQNIPSDPIQSDLKNLSFFPIPSGSGLLESNISGISSSGHLQNIPACLVVDRIVSGVFFLGSTFSQVQLFVNVIVNKGIFYYLFIVQQLQNFVLVYNLDWFSKIICLFQLLDNGCYCQLLRYRYPFYQRTKVLAGDTIQIFTFYLYFAFIVLRFGGELIQSVDLAVLFTFVVCFCFFLSLFQLKNLEQTGRSQNYQRLSLRIFPVLSQDNILNLFCNTGLG
eukprot:TRINITY_DN7785_c2_g2_i2.p1 TRINITY_DN7785_c2_g2~~TRINITY_DN7785_c2_g2_i2.p1  ORF type:complete len:320 (+),score=21.29 TRINITY_DN7785_c2_g2_i2:3-962(+)